MNTPPRIQLSTSPAGLSDKSAQVAVELSPDVQYKARNLEASTDGLKMEVQLAGRWQSVKLALDPPPSRPVQLAEATVQFSDNGRSVTVLAPATQLTVKQGDQLVNLLKLVLGRPQSSPLTLTAEQARPNEPRLTLPQIGATLSLSPSIAKLLPPGGQSIIILQSAGPGVSAQLSTPQGQALTTLSLKPERVAQWLAGFNHTLSAKKVPTGLMLTQGGQSVALKQADGQSALQPGVPATVKLALKDNTLQIRAEMPAARLSLAPQQARITSTMNILSAAPKEIQNPVAGGPAKAQPDPATADAVRAQAVNDAKPQKAASTWSTLRQIAEIGIGKLLSPQSSPTPEQQTQLKAANPVARQPSELGPLMEALQRVNISAPASQPAAFYTLNSHQPLTQLMTQIRRLVAGNQSATQQEVQTRATPAVPIAKSTSPSTNAAQTPSPAAAITAGKQTPAAASAVGRLVNAVVTQLPGPVTQPLGKADVKGPIEASLLPQGPSKMSVAARQQLTHIMTSLVSTPLEESPELGKLVNQAFSRMMDERTGNPVAVQNTLLASSAPGRLTPALYQSSLPGALDQILVSLLAGHILAPAQQSTRKHTSSAQLDAVLQVLLPQLKKGAAQNLAQQLQQLPQAKLQTLMGELSQLQQGLSPQSNAAQQQQTDNNPLVQFLLPMKLPPEAGQTELRIGRYQKKNKVKGTDKTVWFVRLNFDYGPKGQLQVNAELMDKALDCQMLASSAEIAGLAEGHLDALSQKLGAHGLQVGDMAVSRQSRDNEAFYRRHTIINVKV